MYIISFLTASITTIIYFFFKKLAARLHYKTLDDAFSSNIYYKQSNKLPRGLYTRDSSKNIYQHTEKNIILTADDIGSKSQATYCYISPHKSALPLNTYVKNKNLQLIYISLIKQELSFFENSKHIKNYLISSGKNGAGQTINSYQTPLGLHYIEEIIGTGCNKNTYFIGRKPQGIFNNDSIEDPILDRIIRIKGAESGYNHGMKDSCSVDSFERYIYIHGSNNVPRYPASKGCIRMQPDDIIELCNLLKHDCIIVISEKQLKNHFYSFN